VQERGEVVDAHRWVMASGLSKGEYGKAFQAASMILREVLLASRGDTRSDVAGALLSTPERVCERIVLPPSIAVRARAVLAAFEKRRGGGTSVAAVPLWIGASILGSVDKCRELLAQGDGLVPGLPAALPAVATVRKQLADLLHLSLSRMQSTLAELVATCPEIATSASSPAPSAPPSSPSTASSVSPAARALQSSRRRRLLVAMSGISVAGGIGLSAGTKRSLDEEAGDRDDGKRARVEEGGREES
jgi:hypothetical protein